MHEGKFVFTQMIKHLSKYEFDKCVKRYGGNYRVKSFSCWSQFLCLVFGQMTHRESLRDIVTCLSSRPRQLYHLGIRSQVELSTLSRANKNRDWRIYADFAQHLIAKAQSLLQPDSTLFKDLNESVYAFDSSTIDLCLSVFPWTPATIQSTDLEYVNGNPTLRRNASIP